MSAEAVVRRQLEAYNDRDLPFEMVVAYQVVGGVIAALWTFDGG